MLINKPAIFLLLLTFCAFIAGCKKNELHTSAYAPVDENGSRVKVVFTSAYQKNPRFQINLNGTRVSTTLQHATNGPFPFPGGGLNTGGGSTADYVGIPAQSNVITVATPKFSTNIDSVQLATSTFTYEAGKKYTLFFADTAANTQAVLVEDSLARPDSGFAKYKFVNLMPDLPALDLYIGTVKVASNIPYKGVSPSFTLPTNNPSTTWAIRTVGGTTNLVTYAGTTSIPNQRVLTVFAKGYNSITTSPDIRRRNISLIFTN